MVTVKSREACPVSEVGGFLTTESRLKWHLGTYLITSVEALGDHTSGSQDVSCCCLSYGNGFCSLQIL